MAEETPTMRKQMESLRTAMQQDETAAVREADALFKTDGMTEFMNELKALQERTVPGSNFDQVFTSSITVLEATMKLVDQTVNPPVTQSA